MQIVAALRANPKFITLNLSLDALRAFVANDLRDFLGLILLDALLEGGLDLVVLARSVWLSGVEALQRDAAFDQLGLEHIQNGFDAVF